MSQVEELEVVEVELAVVEAMEATKAAAAVDQRCPVISLP